MKLPQWLGGSAQAQTGTHAQNVEVGRAEPKTPARQLRHLARVIKLIEAGLKASHEGRVEDAKAYSEEARKRRLLCAGAGFELPHNLSDLKALKAKLEQEAQ